MKKITKATIILSCLLFVCIRAHAEGENDYFTQRHKMVSEQLAARDIKDKKVLEAMYLVERHKFVPPGMREHAYEDVAIALSEGQTLAASYSVAYAAQALQLKGDEKILQVGIESGYQAAVLAVLAKEVYCVETSENVALQAESRLKALGFKNITVKVGDRYSGWEEYAPFDSIIAIDPLACIPQKLIDQLKIGGKLLISVGDKNLNKLFIAQKQAGGKLKKYDLVGTLVGQVVEKKKESGQETHTPPPVKETITEGKKWATSKDGKWKVRR